MLGLAVSFGYWGVSSFADTCSQLVNEVVELFPSGGEVKVITIFTDEQALEEFQKGGNPPADKSFWIFMNEKVLVLECDSPHHRAKIRVIGKEHYGKEGWVPLDWITRSINRTGF